MYRGKRTCKILKEIRQEIARANDISLVTSECRYQGDCAGTCPKCEAEVAYLEQQLNLRRMAGKAVVLSGLVASSWMVPLASQASEGVDVLTNKQLNALKVDSVPKQIELSPVGDVPKQKRHEREEIYGSIYEPMPTYPGGDAALVTELSENFIVPKDTEYRNGKVTVVVKIEIMEDGSIGEIKVVRGVNPEVDAAAIEAVKKLKRFNPVKIKGEAVKDWLTVPVVKEQKINN
jgi:TonB family protein